MKITDVRCIYLPSLKALLLRIDTDEGVYGLSQVEMSKHNYLAPQIFFYKQFIIGLDPRNVEDVVRRIRRLGGFKPWGGAVSSIEIALWDIAGKAAGLPIHRLLGGKVRDMVRPYMGGPPPFTRRSFRGIGRGKPEDFYNQAIARKEMANGMSIMKFTTGFHNDDWRAVAEHHYGISYPEVAPSPILGFPPNNLGQNAGMVTERSLSFAIECLTAAREALGDDFEMAVDVGPGWKVPGAHRIRPASRAPAPPVAGGPCHR